MGSGGEIPDSFAADLDESENDAWYAPGFISIRTEQLLPSPT